MVVDERRGGRLIGFKVCKLHLVVCVYVYSRKRRRGSLIDRSIDRGLIFALRRKIVLFVCSQSNANGDLSDMFPVPLRS